MATSNKPHTFNPSVVTTPPPTYDQVCITPLLPSSRLITLAGQTGLHYNHTISSVFTNQVYGAYEAVHNCLKAAGATPRDIVQVRHYIVKDTGNPDLDRLDVVDRGWGVIWTEFMDRTAGGHRPPDTVVGVASLAKKELMYEVEVWAVVNT